MKKNLDVYLFYYFLILLIFSYIFLFTKHEVGNDSTISEWFINYEGGFTKRGIVGQIAIELSRYFQTGLRWTIFILQTLTVTIYFFLLFNFLKKLKFERVIILSIFTPIFILYPVAEIEVSFGFTQEQRGFYNDAINRYDRAFRIRKKILGEAHEYTRAVHRMLVRARTRSKAANSSTDHPNEDVLLTSVAIKNAIKTINQSSHVKNIARRCYALNPYLQAELVYSTGLSSATKRVLVKRFKKHQDLLDDLLLEIEQFKAGIPINTKEMIHIIKASLNRVTEEPVVTFKMEREILSACPLRISQLKKIFQGVEKSEADDLLRHDKLLQLEQLQLEREAAKEREAAIEEKEVTPEKVEPEKVDSEKGVMASGSKSARKLFK